MIRFPACLLSPFLLLYYSSRLIVRSVALYLFILFSVSAACRVATLLTSISCSFCLSPWALSHFTFWLAFLFHYCSFWSFFHSFVLFYTHVLRLSLSLHSCLFSLTSICRAACCSTLAFSLFLILPFPYLYSCFSLLWYFLKSSGSLLTSSLFFISSFS